MNRLVLCFAVISTGCTDRNLLKDTSAAYQYQKGVYQHVCPLKPEGPDNRTQACKDLDAKLTDQEAYVKSATRAVSLSEGGALPKSAVKKLKEIKKDLDQ